MGKPDTNADTDAEPDPLGLHSQQTSPQYYINKLQVR